MKKILVTGGAGFIGGDIILKLSDMGGYDITVLDSLSEQIHGKHPKESFLYQRIQGKCKFIQADICDLSAVQNAVSDVETIIHLAAETGTGQSMYQINRYNEVNIMGTSNLFQAITSLGARSRVRQMILSSSRSVYGEGKYDCPQCGTIYPDGREKQRMEQSDFGLYCSRCGEKLRCVPTTEDSAAKPNSLYAFTKYAQEQMLQTMCAAMGMDYTIFRFQNVYGVGQSLKNPYTGILSIFSSLLLENKDLNIFEDGMETRDFVNVADVADAVIAALANPQCNGHTINIGSGKATTVMDIAQKLKSIYKSQSNLVVTGDFRMGDIAHNYADIQKARELLGFAPKITLEQGLADFCAWVLGQETDTGGYEASLAEMEQNGMLFRKD